MGNVNWIFRPDRRFPPLVEFLIILLICVSTAANSQTAQKKSHRLALVIGNRTYVGKPFRPLVSPIKDARDIWQVLSEAGFKTDNDYLVLDGNGRRLRSAVEEFGLQVRQVRKDILKRNAQESEAIVVAVFLSGHGFTVNDTAYFAGSDASGEYIEDLMDQSVSLNQLIRDLTPVDRDVDFLSVIFVDACRSNAPLPSRASIAGKGLPLNMKNPFRQIQGIGRITVFATTDGKPSYDGSKSTENSVFTAAIIEAASTPRSPSSFSEFVERIEKNTPKIAKARFGSRVDQWPEIYRTGITSDFFWNTDVEISAGKTADFVNAKGIDQKSIGWVWIGDYGVPAGQEARAWLTPRFTSSKGVELPAPTEISPGTQLTIQANLNVRDVFPKKDGNCGKEKKYQDCAKLMGTIPKGLKVTTLDFPKSVGAQNWVKVEFDSSALYK